MIANDFIVRDKSFFKECEQTTPSYDVRINHLIDSIHSNTTIEEFEEARAKIPLFKWSFGSSKEGSPSVLHEAVTYNNIDLIKHILHTEGLDLLEQRDGFNYTLLDRAILHGRYETVKTLVECGVSVNIISGGQFGALDSVGFMLRLEDKGESGKMTRLLFINGAKVCDTSKCFKNITHAWISFSFISRCVSGRLASITKLLDEEVTTVPGINKIIIDYFVEDMEQDARDMLEVMEITKKRSAKIFTALTFLSEEVNKVIDSYDDGESCKEALTMRQMRS